MLRVLGVAQCVFLVSFDGIAATSSSSAWLLTYRVHRHGITDEGITVQEEAGFVCFLKNDGSKGEAGTTAFHRVKFDSRINRAPGREKR